MVRLFERNVTDQTAEFRRRRYSKTSVRGEIRPKIGNFRYSSDICVVLPDLRNIRQIFVVCLTSRNIRQIFDSSSTTNEREACPQPLHSGVLANLNDEVGKTG